jgi:hypothetical protein
MKIYDTDGETERDWAWLQDKFGLGVRVDPRPDPSQPGYEVVELRAKLGPCTLVAQVVDENGTPMVGVDVARWWNDPGLAALPAGLATWRPLGVYGPTNANGDIGFGMGGEDGYDPAWPLERLPVSEIWTPLNSGRIHGVGWMWGTDLLCLNVKFRWVPGGEEPPPPEPPPGDGDVAQAIRDAGHEIALAIAGLAWYGLTLTR